MFRSVSLLGRKKNDGFGSRRPGDFISHPSPSNTMDFEPRMEALGWESPDEDLIQVDENVPAALRSAAYASSRQTV